MSRDELVAIDDRYVWHPFTPHSVYRSEEPLMVVGGEGIQGLTAPLLEAGARAVVATTWPVADRSTVPFVAALYDRLARGEPVSDALRAVKLDALRRGAPPREGAAFTGVGDPLVRVPLDRPRRAPRPALVALALALLITLAAAAARASRRARG